MAIVSGQSLLSGHNLAELDPAANSDDEYDYVSSLAEQIAHAMLDEEEALEKENAFCSESPSHPTYGNSFFTRSGHGSAASTATANANPNPWNSGGWRWDEQQQQVRGNGFHGNLRAAAQAQQAWEAQSTTFLNHCNNSGNNSCSNVCYHGNALQQRSAFSTSNVNEMIAAQRLRRMVCGRGYQSNGCWTHFDARVNNNIHNPPQNTSPPAHLNPNSVIFRKESVGTGVFLPRVKAFTPPRRNKSSSSSDFSSQKCYSQERKQNNINRSPSNDTKF